MNRNPGISYPFHDVNDGRNSLSITLLKYSCSMIRPSSEPNGEPDNRLSFRCSGLSSFTVSSSRRSPMHEIVHAINY